MEERSHEGSHGSAFSLEEAEFPMEEPTEEVAAEDKEDKPKIPDWIEELSPTEVKVYFRGDDEWAILRTMSAADHIRLDRMKKKLTNTEFSALMVAASVTEWTFEHGEGFPVPIPKDRPANKHQAEIWEHVPTRWFQRMSIASAVLMDPGDDRLGGLSAEVFKKEEKASEQED